MYWKEREQCYSKTSNRHRANCLKKYIFIYKRYFRGPKTKKKGEHKDVSASRSQMSLFAEDRLKGSCSNDLAVWHCALKGSGKPIKGYPWIRDKRKRYGKITASLLENPDSHLTYHALYYSLHPLQGILNHSKNRTMSITRNMMK